MTHSDETRNEQDDEGKEKALTPEDHNRHLREYVCHLMLNRELTIERIRLESEQYGWRLKALELAGLTREEAISILIHRGLQ